MGELLAQKFFADKLPEPGAMHRMTAEEVKYWEEINHIVQTLDNPSCADSIRSEIHEAQQELTELIEKYRQQEETLCGRIVKKIKNFIPHIPPKEKAIYLMLLTRILPLEFGIVKGFKDTQHNPPESITEISKKEFSKKEKDLLKNLERLVGEDEINLTYHLSKAQKETDRYGMTAHSPDITFEKLQSFRQLPEAMKAVMTDTIPPGLSANVGEIAYEDELVPAHSEYGLSEGAVEIAHAEWNGKKIIFTKGAQGLPADTIFNDTLLHETGHFNDWISNDLLTPTERLALLHDVVARVQSPDRYKSDYVEEIANQDKQVEMRLKAHEYYAEITAAYLNDDPFLPEEDAKLVKSIVDKVNPGFDRDQALRTRDIIVEAYNP